MTTLFVALSRTVDFQRESMKSELFCIGFTVEALF